MMIFTTYAAFKKWFSRSDMRWSQGIPVFIVDEVTRYQTTLACSEFHEIMRK